jgi:hypothetical protein
MTSVHPDLDIFEGVLEKWKHIVENGVAEEGTSPDCNIENLPSWLSHDRFLKGQAIVRDKRLSLFFSSFSGLLFLLQLPIITIPLTHTKKSESLGAIFHRYLDTSLHVRRWYMQDLLDKNSTAFKSLNSVRKMHVNAITMMKDVPLKSSDFSNATWISQYSMIITQWAFIGPLLMFPDKCGLHAHGEELQEILEAITYVWRVIGFLLGIKDEYNLCQEDYRETIQLSHIIFNQIIRPYLTDPLLNENPGYHMGLDVSQSMATILEANIKGEVVMNYWCQVFGLKETSCIPMTYTDSWLKTLLHFLMRYLLRVKWIVPILSNLLDEKLDRADKGRLKQLHTLRRRSQVKYLPIIPPTSKCPFSFELMSDRRQTTTTVS